MMFVSTLLFKYILQNQNNLFDATAPLLYFLTEAFNFWKDVAEKIYERHLFFTEQLVAVGVDQKTAEQDACRIEHAISEESFQKLKASVKK